MLRRSLVSAPSVEEISADLTCESQLLMGCAMVHEDQAIIEELCRMPSSGA